MRSRFSAFATGDVAYLRDTWHPATRPARLDLDPGQQWTRLEILGRTGGGMFDADGTVEFRAHYRDGSTPGALHENSSFVRDSGRWLYVEPLYAAGSTA
jgi:SEC-C motif-containing protein